MAKVMGSRKTFSATDKRGISVSSPDMTGKCSVHEIRRILLRPVKWDNRQSLSSQLKVLINISPKWDCAGSGRRANFESSSSRWFGPVSSHIVRDVVQLVLRKRFTGQINKCAGQRKYDKALSTSHLRWRQMFYHVNKYLRAASNIFGPQYSVWSFLDSRWSIFSIWRMFTPIDILLEQLSCTSSFSSLWSFGDEIRNFILTLPFFSEICKTFWFSYVLYLHFSTLVYYQTLSR